ncbi:MAG: hypothetical protein RIC55_02290 [Pirellulaceae bacterium]
MSLTLKTQFHVSRQHRGRKRLATGPRPTVGHGAPRVAKLLALAIRFDRLVSDGTVANYADLARLGRVSRARLTQIMNLLHLAPDIQEEILFLPATERGMDGVTERDLRPIVTEADWGRQRRMWRP